MLCHPILYYIPFYYIVVHFVVSLRSHMFLEVIMSGITFQNQCNGLPPPRFGGPADWLLCLSAYPQQSPTQKEACIVSEKLSLQLIPRQGRNRLPAST